MKLGIIGAGNMASAIIGGIVKKGIIPANEIICSSPVEAEREKAADAFGINVTASNIEVVKKSEVILLAVKPQVIPVVVEEIKEDTDDAQLIISIVAGKTIKWFNEAFGRKMKIVRTMPNTPALVGMGAFSLDSGNDLTDEEKEFAQRLFESLGIVEWMPENLIDTACGLAGAGPAYIYLVIEALADGGVAEGLPRKTAQNLAAQTVMGAAKMVLETGQHPGFLKDQVCSPGGNTIVGIKTLEEHGVRGAFIETVINSTIRTHELGKGK